MTDATGLAARSAAQIGPKGFGGWLVIPILGLIITPPFILYSLFTWFSPLLDEKIRTDVFSGLSKGQMFLAYELVSSLIMLALAVVCLVRLKRHSRKFPSLMITFLCVNFAAHLGSAIVTVWYYDSIGMSPPGRAGQGSFGSLLGILIWVPYFIRSKRVKNTFTA